MFKFSRIVPVTAVALAMLVSVPAFAKVPFHARQANRDNVTAIAPHPYMHQSYMHQGTGRYRHFNGYHADHHGRACTHSHRFSGQHWM